MKKKVLSALLCATMAATMMTGCGGDKETSDVQTPDTEKEAVVEETEQEVAEAPAAEMADPEDLPAEAFAHLTFDGEEDEGYVAVTQTEDVGDNDGATYGLAEATDAALTYSTGAVGNALYLDGTFGLDLGLEATNTDAYTVSFWVNADRLSTFGPTLQMGYNMGKASDADNDVTWLNVTQSEWGADSAKIFPIVWSRNEASDAADGTDCWPWMYAFDNEIHGKQEWCMVTIVCTGEEQNGPTGATTAGAQFYVNGVKMYDSQDNYENGSYFEYTWDATLAPNIMQPGDNEFKALFGINYWDTVFRGYVDDLYVYDSALTPGQVASLYLLGDASAETTTADASAEEETEVAANTHDDVTTTGTVVGSTDCTTAFWSDFSDVVEVPEGETATVNFKNYTDGVNNWDNFLVILQNVADAHSTDDNADYAEYAVLRADNFGWGAGYDGVVEPTCDWDWDTFASVMDGADVTLTITNNGDTADVTAVVVGSDGNTYNQSYPGIAITGDLYYCLSVEAGFLDIQ